MKKSIGMTLLLVGMIFTLIFGMQIVGGNEILELFGFQLDLREGNHWALLFVSFIIFLAGIFIMIFSKKTV